MNAGLKHCHPERGLIFALEREDQPQSKDLLFRAAKRTLQGILTRN